MVPLNVSSHGVLILCPPSPVKYATPSAIERVELPGMWEGVSLLLASCLLAGGGIDFRDTKLSAGDKSRISFDPLRLSGNPHSESGIASLFRMRSRACISRTAATRSEPTQQQQTRLFQYEVRSKQKPRCRYGCPRGSPSYYHIRYQGLMM